MSISRKEVEYVANLARIKLNEKELKEYSSQLAKILDYINKLKELDIEKVQAMTHVLDVKNVLRKDLLKNSIKQEEVLSCAPSKDKDYFRVPKVIE